MNIGDINLADPDAFSIGVPHAYFAMLRREAPISWVPRAGDDGFWAVTRYADIQAIERNVEVFTSRTNLLPLPIPEETLARDIDHVLVLTDPPRHTFLRRIIMSAFTPKAVARLGERIQVLAREVVDAVIERGTCNLVDLAAYVPIEVVADMVGLPREDRAQLFTWANATLGSSDPGVVKVMDSKKAAGQMFAYARELGLKRRSAPQDDIFSTIATAREDGEMLSDVDLGSFFLLLATAGNETTRTLILQGVLTLLQHPEQMERLRADRTLLSNAVEEMLRWTTPVLCFGRKATKDVVVSGQLIKAGQQVVLWYCSGSRDEEVFENPDVFDIERRNAREHQAFGAKGGIHQCLGSMLARTEVHAVFNEMLSRMPDIELAGPVVRLRSNFANGIKEMPIRFTPGRVIGQSGSGRLYATENEVCTVEPNTATAGVCPVSH
ncbi:MAG: cytochrome P450 [Azoarcus sp.]|nr:cytochrome P450 [Azoarcus sp.]